MTLSSTYRQLRADAMASATERRAVARALEEAADGLRSVLDTSSAALSPETWDSAVARLRSEELTGFVGALDDAADDVAATVADLRAEAQRFDQVADWYDTQYWIAWNAERTTTVLARGAAPDAAA